MSYWSIVLLATGSVFGQTPPPAPALLDVPPVAPTSAFEPATRAPATTPNRPDAAEGHDHAVSPPGSVESPPGETWQALGELVTALIRDNLPAEFEARDKWGQTTEVWDGLHVRREGWQVKTKRRKKQVNDGSWKLYRVRLIDPDANLDIELVELRPLPDGRIQFEIAADARLDVFARLSQWERGVQLLSLSVDAEARTQLRVRCDLALRLDLSRLPPDVILDPAVRAVELRLVEFRLNRVSQLGGSVAHELGRQARGRVEKELARQSDKLPEKFNRQIDKNRDRLRLSIHDMLASKWGSLAATQLGLNPSD